MRKEWIGGSTRVLHPEALCDMRYNSCCVVLDQLTLHDYPVLVIREGAGLQGHHLLAFDRAHNLDIFRAHYLFIEDPVYILSTGRIGNGDLVTLFEPWKLVEDFVRGRAGVSDAVAGYVSVRPLLPGVPRAGDADGSLFEILLGDRVKDRYVLQAQLRDIQGELLVLGASGVAAEVEWLDGRYRARGGVGADEKLARTGIVILRSRLGPLPEIRRAGTLFAREHLLRGHRLYLFAGVLRRARA